MAWRWPQSHFRQVRHKTDFPLDYYRATSGTPDLCARRALLRSAVFDARDHELWSYRPATSVVTGVIAGVREDGIVLDSRRGTELFTISPATATWLGAPTTPAALRPGDPVIIRHRTPDPAAPMRRLAECVWARIGRVTGTIIAAYEREFLVDTGSHDRPSQHVVIAPASARQVQVRFPKLAPGYLLDVIGTRHGDHLLAVAPATAQPPYRAGHSPAPPLVNGPIPACISGSVVWHEPGDEPPDMLGLGYPALDPETTDPETGDQPADGGTGCVRLPYLSLGAAVRIRNECSDRTALLPVTSDGALHRQFCDRCVKCGTSPKGRLADLTMAAFVELGGSLEDGCFNATMTLAG